MRRLVVEAASARPADWQPVVDWLRQGGLVVFPTDTFYGLAADPTSQVAIGRLFALKGRADTSALPFIAASEAQVEAWCGPLTGVALRLARAFWPGPLSIVFDAPDAVDPAVLGGSGSVAIRVPDHVGARALAAAWGAPLPATSANRSGAPPARSVDAIDAIGEDPGVLVVDGGATPGGAPSTIVDARDGTVRLVREGAIAWKRVLDWLDG